MAKNGKGGGGRYKGIPKDIRKVAKAMAGLQYGGAIKGQKKLIAGTKAHNAVIDNAFAAYQNRLTDLQGAQQGAVADSRLAHQDAVTAMEGATSHLSSDAQAALAQRAQLLGQGPGAAPAAGLLAGQAAGSRLDLAGARDQSMADIGLAAYSDMDRRAATGARDQIRAREDNRQLKLSQKEDLAGAKAEKKAGLVGLIQQLMQQDVENKFAKRGLDLQELEIRSANRLARRQYQTERKQTNKQSIRDQRAHAQDIKEEHHAHSGQNASGSAGGGGLSPSQREEFKDTKEKVNAALAAYQKAREQGASKLAAKKRVRRRLGAERWQVNLASQIADRGGLTPQGTKLWKSKVPGGKVPGKWS